MAAEHYKEKYKECQRLQKHVLRLSDQQGGVGPARHQPPYFTLLIATELSIGVYYHIP